MHVLPGLSGLGLLGPRKRPGAVDGGCDSARAMPRVATYCRPASAPRRGGTPKLEPASEARLDPASSEAGGPDRRRKDGQHAGSRHGCVRLHRRPTGRGAGARRPRRPRDDRNPERYAATGTPVFGDVSDPDSLRAALDGVEAAYYLVHSLDAVDFVRRDAGAALAFGRAARGADLRRVVYLGGLGNDADQLSAHLRSRREVERLLTATGVPVTVLRAGIVLGAGSLSFELMRQLVVRLPVMVTPRWVKTRSQPIAVTDVVAYLVGVLTADEVGDDVGHGDRLRAGLDPTRGAITGRRTTSCRISSKDRPPAPSTMPARSTVTGTPVAVSSRSTSRRLRRWAES